MDVKSGPVLLRRDLTIEIGEGPAQRIGLAAQAPAVRQLGGVVRHRRPGRIGVDDLQLGDELGPPLQERAEIRPTATKQAHWVTTLSDARGGSRGFRILEMCGTSSYFSPFPG
jgi:hypothetical protein